MDFKGSVDSSVETKKYFDDEYVIDLKALFLKFKALWHYDGISELLTNQGKDGLNSANIDNLYVMLAGKTPPNPSEILSSSHFAEMAETLKEQFDYIIIDTPPVAAGSDATIVSRVVDGTVFVLRNGFTSKKVAKCAINELSNNGGRAVGVVLSRVKASSQDYGRHGYYGYYGCY